MTAEWPESVLRLEQFLKSLPMECLEKTVDPQHFGNRVLEYSDSVLMIRVVLDRGSWSIEIGGVGGPTQWHDIGLLRAMLSDEACALQEYSIEDQAFFLRQNWPLITPLFDMAHRDDTFAALAKLGERRSRKLFPRMY